MLDAGEGDSLIANVPIDTWVSTTTTSTKRPDVKSPAEVEVSLELIYLTLIRDLDEYGLSVNVIAAAIVPTITNDDAVNLLYCG